MKGNIRQIKQLIGFACAFGILCSISDDAWSRFWTKSLDTTRSFKYQSTEQLMKVSKQGDLEAKYELLWRGFLWKSDQEQAEQVKKWHIRTKEDDVDIEAHYMLGECYRTGTVVKRNEDTAMTCFQIAANKKDYAAKNAFYAMFELKNLRQKALEDDQAAQDQILNRQNAYHRYEQGVQKAKAWAKAEMMDINALREAARLDNALAHDRLTLLSETTQQLL